MKSSCDSGGEQKGRRMSGGEMPRQRKISLEERHRKISNEEHYRRMSAEERLRRLHEEEEKQLRDGGETRKGSLTRVKNRNLCHQLPQVVEDGQGMPKIVVNFCLDSSMDRRRRNNDPALDVSGISGLLAKKAQAQQDEDEDEEEEEPFPKYGSADEFYDLNEEIGKGAYGIVKMCMDKSTGERCAAKIVKTSNSNLRKETMREIEMMRLLGRHKKLVGLLDAYHTPFEIVMILEYVEGGELFERIIEEDYLMEEDAINYVHQVLQALEFMHSKNIVHLDLKPENIMCESKDSTQIKLVDFGLARQLKDGEEAKSSFGTPDFVAPEVIRMKPVSRASDMWSLGVVTYVLLSGLMPFSGENDHDTLVKVAKADWDFDDECFDEVSEDAKDFIEGLLIKEPSERYTIEECLELPWIKAQHQMGKIDTKKHKSFFAKRRWKKSINALVAVRRMSLSPLAMRARRGSMPPGTGQGTKKAEEGSDRKGSFPVPFQQRSFTESRASAMKYKGLLSVDSRDNSFDESEELGFSKYRTDMPMNFDITATRARSHTFSGDISVPTPKHETDNRCYTADSKSSRKLEVNNNGIRIEMAQQEDKTLDTSKDTKELAHVGHVVLKIDAKDFKTEVSVGRATCNQTPNMLHIRSQTTEENHVAVSRKIQMQVEEGLRIRSEGFQNDVPSIVLNDTHASIAPARNVVSVSTCTATTADKRVVCKTETTETRTPNGHAWPCSSAEHNIESTGFYTFRTVDQKGQTITVKLDGMNSLELPVDRQMCNHLRRASTGSEAIEMLKTIESKLG